MAGDTETSQADDEFTVSTAKSGVNVFQRCQINDVHIYNMELVVRVRLRKCLLLVDSLLRPGAKILDIWNTGHILACRVLSRRLPDKHVQRLSIMRYGRDV